MATIDVNATANAAYQLSGRLKQTLSEAFPGAETRLEISPYSDKISGFVIWEGFSGQTPIERQQRVWAAIKARFQPAEQRDVSAIFSLTPEEEQSILEDE
jgi:acid stress-induced BolA-like protein IbaG/YrbA